MIKTFLTDSILHIVSSEGYSLTFRGDTSGETFNEIYIPISRDISNLVEIKTENIPVYIPELPEDIESKAVDEIQQYLIQQTKEILESFLQNNPLLFEGKYYSVTTEAQVHLNAVIKAAEYANSLNIEYVPTWNDIEESRQAYNLDTLKILFIKIQQYVSELVIQQQEMEKEILNTADKFTLLNYNISYQL